MPRAKSDKTFFDVFDAIGHWTLAVPDDYDPRRPVSGFIDAYFPELKADKIVLPGEAPVRDRIFAACDPLLPGKRYETCLYAPKPGMFLGMRRCEGFLRGYSGSVYAGFPGVLFCLRYYAHVLPRGLVLFSPDCGRSFVVDAECKERVPFGRLTGDHDIVALGDWPAGSPLDSRFGFLAFFRERQTLSG